jgi:hypothetical protein
VRGGERENPHTPNLGVKTSGLGVHQRGLTQRRSGLVSGPAEPRTPKARSPIYIFMGTPFQSATRPGRPQGHDGKPKFRVVVSDQLPHSNTSSRLQALFHSLRRVLCTVRSLYFCTIGSVGHIEARQVSNCQKGSRCTIKQHYSRERCTKQNSGGLLASASIHRNGAVTLRHQHQIPGKKRCGTQE